MIVCTFSLIYFLVCIAAGLGRATEVRCSEELYVELNYCNGIEDGSSCGFNSTKPCSSISAAAALRLRGKRPTQACIRLLTPVNVSDCESLGSPAENLSDVENVVIEPWPVTRVNGAPSSVDTYCTFNPDGCKIQLDFTGLWIWLAGARNVSFRHLNVVLQGRLTAIEAVQSANVTVAYSNFSSIGINSHALWINNSWPVRISSTNFSGRYPPEDAPPPSKMFNMSALLVGFSCSSPADGCSLELLNEKRTFLIEDTNFAGLGFGRSSDASKRLHPLREATAMKIVITAAADKSLTMVVRRCTFRNNSSPYDSPVSVYFAPGSARSRVTFEQCNFVKNSAYIGGVMFARFGIGINNTMVLSGCTFLNNIAAIEGGVGRVSFWGNGGEAGQLVVDACHFENNTAGVWALLLGGVFLLTKSTDLLTEGVPLNGDKHIYVNRSKFINNAAGIGGGFFMQRVRIGFRDCVYVNNEGGVMHAESAAIYFSGQQNFTSNRMRYLAGGAISLNKNSFLSVDEEANVVFFHNKASYNSGGAIYADDLSSTRSLLQVVESSTNLQAMNKDCFVLSKARVVYGHPSCEPNDFSGSKGQISFCKNEAVAGMDIAATSFSPCAGSSIYPSDKSQPIATNIDNPLPSSSSNTYVASGPAWMFFNMVSCDCFKALPDNKTYWLYQRGSCNSTQIAKDMIKQGYLNDIWGTTDALFLMKKNVRAWLPGVAIPSDEFFLTPWSTSLWEWSSIGLAMQNLSGLPAILSNVSIIIAPGEEFELRIKLVDFRLAVTTATAKLKIAYGDALLRFRGLYYSQTDFIPFQSYQPLVGVALAGVPGTYGALIISADSQVRNLPTAMIIQFYLRNCNPGYSPTGLMRDSKKASFIIQHAQTQPVIKGSIVEELVCLCTSPANGVESCSTDGFNVNIKEGHWTGDRSGRRLYLDSQDHVPRNLSEDAVEEVKAETFSLASGPCYGLLCSANTRTSSWSLRSIDPCNSLYEHAGVMCSDCKSGHHLVPLDLFRCRRCDDENFSANRAQFFFVLLGYSVVLITLCIIFRIGSGATYETWSFAYQVGIFLSTDAFIYLFSSVGRFSAGANICISRHLSAPAQISLTFLLPAFLLSIVFLVLFLFHTTRFRVVIAQFSAMAAIWAVIIWSYNYLIYPSFLLLTCVKFEGEWVFFAQTSLKCFGPGHWPYALLAMLIILGLVIIFPIVFVRGREWRFINTLSKIYLKPLHKDRHWFVAVMMLRRLLLVLVCTYAEGVLRQLLAIVIFQLLLLLHFATPPFRTSIDNSFEAVNYVILSVLSAIGLMDLSTYKLLAVFLSIYSLPSMFAIIIFFYGIRHDFHKKFVKLKRQWQRSGPSTSTSCSSQAGPDNIQTSTSSHAGATSRKSGNTGRAKKVSAESTSSLELRKHSFRDPLLADTLAELDY